MKYLLAILAWLPVSVLAYQCNGNRQGPEAFQGFIECRYDYPPFFDGYATSMSSSDKHLFLQKFIGKPLEDVTRLIGQPHAVLRNSNRWLLSDPSTLRSCFFEVDAPLGVIEGWTYFQTDRACDRYFKVLYREVTPNIKLEVIFPETGE